MQVTEYTELTSMAPHPWLGRIIIECRAMHHGSIVAHERPAGQLSRGVLPGDSHRFDRLVAVALFGASARTRSQESGAWPRWGQVLSLIHI